LERLLARPCDHGLELDEGSYVKCKPLWSEGGSGVNAPIGNRQVAD